MPHYKKQRESGNNKQVDTLSRMDVLLQSLEQVISKKKCDDKSKKDKKIPTKTTK